MRYPVVTIGNFDGVHKGHAKLIEKVVSIAKKHNGQSILFTFCPHPVAVLAPELMPPLLQTREQKIDEIKKLGIDRVIVRPFTKKIATQTADDFFEKIIVKELGAKELVVGYDFTFGLHRTGTTEHLLKLGKKFGVKIHIVRAFFYKESLISSTHIRHFIELGRIDSANAMLGRAFSISGRVVKGRGIGAELGFSTANLKPKKTLIPPTGVYITAVKIGSKGKWLQSITNIGYNPSFGGTELVIETHILGFNKRLNGQHIEVRFHKFIRREMAFETMDALRAQIRNDIKEVKEYYPKNP